MQSYHAELLRTFVQNNTTLFSGRRRSEPRSNYRSSCRRRCATRSKKRKGPRPPGSLPETASRVWVSIARYDRGKCRLRRQHGANTVKGACRESEKAISKGGLRVKTYQVRRENRKRQASKKRLSEGDGGELAMKARTMGVFGIAEVDVLASQVSKSQKYYSIPTFRQLTLLMACRCLWRA